MRILLLIFALSASVSIFGQNSPKVSDLQKERQAALKDIEETNRLLKENKATFSTELNRLNLLKRKVSSRKQIISSLNTEIDSMSLNIKQKENQLAALESSLKKKKTAYAASINKYWQRRNNQDILLFLLSAQNFTQSYHRLRYLKEYSNWQKQQGEEIIATQELINREKALIEEQLGMKQTLLGERKTEEVKLSREEVSQQATVKTLETNNKKLQQELAKKKRQAEALNRQIEKIIAEETAKSEKKAQTTSGETRTATVKGGYAMTQTERTLSDNMANNKGKLPYPVRGNFMVVSNFGINQHKELSRVSINNSGIDIETTEGNEARTVFNGVVSRVFTLPGYNYSIIVRHGNYLTLYANIAQVFVKQGETVVTGQALGKIYTDPENGSSTLLHFELWKERTKLNPAEWLKR
ncbi:MAG: peptidoglycan DD-metalloendopeptidase family protein [Dysgonamonadaceae bacterium]|jgi:septal ring factor EnvC (AmiA/AmiB activator)|nr:peptidoglycan DD-metalloendopeptidase family protein [Dysgonamonadaceae bacterium]